MPCFLTRKIDSEREKKESTRRYDQSENDILLKCLSIKCLFS